MSLSPRWRSGKAAGLLGPLLVLPAAARAQDSPWSSRGEVALESRAFWEGERSADVDAITPDQGLGLLGRLEVRHRHGRFEEKVRAFGRLDHYDEGRSTFIVEEAWGQAQGERWRLRLGADVINWTATEPFHPADVINARNWDSDLENFEKVGEPMAAVQVRLFEGTTLSAFYMPRYTATRPTSRRSRLHFGLPGLPLPPRALVDRNGAFTDSDWGHQGAVSVRQVFGGADLNLHAIEHMDRSQPWPSTLMPALVYQTVRQVGGTYQHVLGPFIVKLEGAYRAFVDLAAPEDSSYGVPPERDHGAVAAGLEYGLAHERGSESTFILEGQALIGPRDPAVRRALTPFQRDVLAAYRYALNDEAGRELMAGVLLDLDEARGLFDADRGAEYVVTLSYQQRLGETWTVKAGLRLFQAQAPPEMEVPRGLQALRHADHVRLTLTRHF
jgi:hypothetical protein